jgi:16S rRNA (cytosine1402-N4)-methyltransferase
MRMDQSGPLTADEVVNTYPADRLARILRDYGEERFARRIADAVAGERSREPITSTLRLADIVKNAIPAAARRTGGNPAKRTFQALRIEVNDELGALRRAVPAALDALAVGGRIVVLSYHSLEDRIVKRALSERSTDTTPPGLPVSLPGNRPQFRLLTSGAERPDDAELTANPRAASARLRAAERVLASAQRSAGSNPATRSMGANPPGPAAA